MTEKKHLNILLAAGGTGGHLFPALALAEELLKQNCRITIATDRRGARFKQDGLDYDIEIISSATLRSGVWGKFQTLAALGKGVLQSFRLIRRIKPDVVVGFGGYPAFPPLFTAQIFKLPNIVHEANGVMGTANKLLAAGTSKIALSLPVTKGVSDHPKFAPKSIVTGNPVRSEIIAKMNAPYPSFNDDSPIHLFIMGGSQGARVFSDIIPAALEKLPDYMQKRLFVAQQCREEDLDRTQKTYDALGISCELKSFFSDVAEQLEKCHLFIGRSGASTVSDVAVVGRPAIFVPLRHEDMQQKFNADVIANVGGGWIMSQDGFTPDALAVKLETLFSLPDTLKAAAQKSAAVGKPDAAANLARLVIDTAR